MSESSSGASTTTAGGIQKLEKLPPKVYWYTFVSMFAWLAYYCTNFWPSVFGVQIMEDWSMSATEVSLLSTAGFVGCIVMPLFASELAERRGAKFVAGLGFALVIISVLPITVVGDNFAGQIILRIIFGFGGGCLNMILNAHLAHWFTKNSRGMATGVVMGGLGLGYTVAAFLGTAFVSAGMDWLMAAFWESLVTAALGLVLYLATMKDFNKEYPGLDSMDDLIDEKQEGQRSTRFDKYHTASNMKEVLTSPQCWMAALFSMCTALTVYGFGYAMPIYLQMDHGMSLEVASAIIGATFAFKIIAAPIGGLLADRAFHGERFQVNMIDSIGGGLLILAILVTPVDFMTAVVIAAFFMVSLYGGTWGTLGIDVAPKAAYNAQALIGTIGSIGSLTATPICGLLIDATGTGAAALIFVAIATMAGAIFAYFSRV